MGIRSLIIATSAAVLLAGCGAADGEGGGSPTAEATSSSASSEPTTTTTTAEKSATASPSATQTPSVAVEQDAELAALLSGLVAGDLPAMSLKPTADMMADCGFDALGCYEHDTTTVYISDDAVAFQRPELDAPQPLHSVGFTRDRDGDAEHSAALQSAAADAEGLAALIPAWQAEYVQPDGSVLPTELFSYACTGLRPDQQGPIVAERCAEFLDVDALPVNQEMTASALTDEIARQRAEADVPALELNPHAAAASEARADLFTPQSQVPLSEYPESVTQHLDAGCAPASYAAQLVHPYDVEEFVARTDELLKGALLAADTSGVGVAIREFDYIDATALFGDRTLKVNGTLVVTTVCT